MVVNWARVELTLDEPGVKRRRRRRVCFLAVKRIENQMGTL